MSPRRRTTANDNSGEFVCPECGRTFARAAALGAHRSRAHGVAGASRSAARSRGKTTGKAPSSRRTSGAARTRAAVTSPRRGRGGSAATQRSRSRAQGQDGGVDRDALLRSLFPNGIPARAEAIREVNAWLDEAQRLSRLR
ncbi:MAG: hypothetical protein V7644_2426 [Actinomycetota bacterium]|jgi:hypothetical protein